MNFNRVPKAPFGGAASALIKLGVIGGLGLYGAMNSLYNVEGGHRAIVFNRLGGIKDKVVISLGFLHMRPKIHLIFSVYAYLVILGNCF